MNGCSGVSNPFTVHNIVSTSTITGLSNVMQNTVENYVVTLNATSTYNWGVTGGILQTGLGTNSVDVFWNTPGQGSIYVIETDANGCVGDTVSLVVTIFQSTDINENQTTNNKYLSQSIYKKYTYFYYKYYIQLSTYPL